VAIQDADLELDPAAARRRSSNPILRTGGRRSTDRGSSQAVLPRRLTFAANRFLTP
jgi:hypothetical protein